LLFPHYAYIICIIYRYIRTQLYVCVCVCTHVHKVEFEQNSISHVTALYSGLVNWAENQLPYTATLHRINRPNVIPPNGRITLLKIHFSVDNYISTNWKRRRRRRIAIFISFEIRRASNRHVLALVNHVIPIVCI